jgi:hypothetical protein
LVRYLPAKLSQIFAAAYDAGVTRSAMTDDHDPTVIAPVEYSADGDEWLRTNALQLRADLI